MSLTGAARALLSGPFLGKGAASPSPQGLPANSSCPLVCRSCSSQAPSLWALLPLLGCVASPRLQAGAGGNRAPEHSESFASAPGMNMQGYAQIAPGRAPKSGQVGRGLPSPPAQKARLV